MRPRIFDTSALIPMIRGEAYEELFRRALRAGRVRMSSVVMQELYAGASSVADKKDLDRIDRAFLSRGYVVTPEHEDWIEAGIMLARYQVRHGNLDPRDHLNDILIVLGAAKLDADLLTENAADMERWKRMLRGRRKQVRVVRVDRRDYRN